MYLFHWGLGHSIVVVSSAFFYCVCAISLIDPVRTNQYTSVSLENQSKKTTYHDQYLGFATAWAQSITMEMISLEIPLSWWKNNAKLLNVLQVFDREMWRRARFFEFKCYLWCFRTYKSICFNQVAQLLKISNSKKLLNFLAVTRLKKSFSVLFRVENEVMLFPKTVLASFSITLEKKWKR